MTPQEQKPNKGWTEKQISEFTAMLKSGLTHLQIARLTGRGKGAISSMAKKVGHVRNRGGMVYHAPKTQRSKGLSFDRQYWDERAFTSYGQRTTLDKLKPNQCHFPMFDDTGYCGCEGVTEKGYCQMHHDLCYVKPKRKKAIDWKNWKPAKC